VVGLDHAVVSGLDVRVLGGNGTRKIAVAVVPSAAVISVVEDDVERSRQPFPRPARPALLLRWLRCRQG
jgi:hypothetical protein